MLNLNAMLLQVRSPLRTTRAKVANWIDKKVENTMLRLLKWILSKRSAQELIANELSFGGPLCRVLRNTVEDNMNSFEVDADNVSGLDKFVEDCMDNFEVDADKVSGLERFVEDLVENIQVSASNVEGLTEAITEAVAEDQDLQTELTSAVMQLIAKKFKD
jgi:uncharacterized membrane protein